MNFEKPTSMTKFDLYNLYYPGRGKNGVNKFFKKNIYNSKILMEEMHKTGFTRTTKMLSIVQVNLIFDHLTPPCKKSKDEILQR